MSNEALREQIVVLLDGHTRYSRDCHLSGEYLCSLIWSTVEDAICPGQHTGTSVMRERVPKVRTSHRRNKEEAARLQEIVDEKYALPEPRT